MQTGAPSILFLIPYFGQWPFWLPLFLRSCQYNEDIHWLLISDCGEPENLPANVSYEHSSFFDYCTRVSQRLGLEFQPDNPYKLCDLKPALGFIHQEETCGYDFWAFGDLDLIYGDLRAYFTDEKLNKYHFLSTHARRVSGHLCIVRNTEQFRALFWHIPQFRERIQDKQHYALDESGYSRLFIKRKNLPKPLHRFFGWFNPLRRTAEFREAFSTPNGKVPWVDGRYNFPDQWVWEGGRLSNSKTMGKTFPYFHFLIWKEGFGDTPRLTEPAYINSLVRDDRWRVDRQGFHRA